MILRNEGQLKKYKKRIDLVLNYKLYTYYMDDNLTAGKLALKAEINVETIRYYEKQGLMPEPERNASGYRIYNNDSLNLLKFIKKAKFLGFSLREIKELENLSVQNGESCKEIHKKAAKKISGIEKKISELLIMKKALLEFSKVCVHETAVKDCRFVHYLENRNFEKENINES